MMGTIEVFEKISSKVRGTENQPEIQEFLDKIEKDLIRSFTDVDWVYAQFAELKSLGYTAQQLFREGDGDIASVCTGDWKHECLLPFLETLYTRLPQLSETFRRLIADDDYQFDKEDRQRPVPTDEECAERQKKWDNAILKRYVEGIAEMRPEIEVQLRELVAKLELEEPQAEGIEAQPEDSENSASEDEGE